MLRHSLSMACLLTAATAAVTLPGVWQAAAQAPAPAPAPAPEPSGDIPPIQDIAHENAQVIVTLNSAFDLADVPPGIKATRPSRDVTQLQGPRNLVDDFLSSLKSESKTYKLLDPGALDALENQNDPVAVVFPLRSLRAEETVALLKSVLDKDVHMAADKNANRILFQGSAEKARAISQLLEHLDTSPDLDPTTAPSSGPSPEDIIKALRGGSRPGGGKTLAPEAEKAPTLRLEGPLGSELVVFGLNNLDAAEAAELLQSILGKDVKLTAEPRNNRILFSGPPDKAKTIQELLRLLDWPPATEVQFKLFQLEHASAIQLQNTIAALFPNGPTVTADVRTNSLIAKGSPGDLRAIEALLLRLDSTDTAPTPEASAAASFSPAELRSLKEDFLRLENRASQLAAQIRAGGAGRDVEQKKKQLQQAVDEAFAARQRLQEGEAQQLQRRVAVVRQSLQVRQSLREQIVSRRVEQLLEDPRMQWNPEQSGAASAPRKPVPDGAELHAPTAAAATPATGAPIVIPQPPSLPPQMPRESVPAVTTLGATGTAPARSAPKPPKANPAVAPLGQRTPVGAAPASRWPGDSTIPAWPAQGGQSPGKSPSEYYDALRKAMDDVNAAPLPQAHRRAQKRLELLRREYETLLKLLEIDIQSAESELELAVQHLERTKKLAEHRAVSTAEVLKAEAQVQHARLRRRRAAELLDLYRAARPQQESGADAPPTLKAPPPDVTADPENAVIPPRDEEVELPLRTPPLDEKAELPRNVPSLDENPVLPRPDKKVELPPSVPPLPTAP